MRPEEFTQMLRDRHGTHLNRSENPARDVLRESFEQYAQGVRERKERLEQSRQGEARYIWEQAGMEIASDKQGVTEDA